MSYLIHVILYFITSILLTYFMVLTGIILGSRVKVCEKNISFLQTHNVTNY